MFDICNGKLTLDQVKNAAEIQIRDGEVVSFTIYSCLVPIFGPRDSRGQTQDKGRNLSHLTAIWRQLFPSLPSKRKGYQHGKE